MTEQQTAVMRQALEKIEKAHAKVAALCTGAERWTMSVPVRPDHDHDVVITDALVAAAEALREAITQAALDKKAENARELGLDYGVEQHPAAPEQKGGAL